MAHPNMRRDGGLMDDHALRQLCDGIRESFPVSSVVGRSVKLTRSGNELKGCCPFHPDRTPSFTIYADDRRWHCFGGCGNGDVIDFVRQAEGVGMIEAIRLLDAGAIPLIPPRVIEWKAESNRTDEALAIWQASTPAAGTPAEAYLRHRGLRLPPTCISLRFARLRLGRRPMMPALVALVSDGEGVPCGIQRTFLSEDGRKAALPDGKVKFSLGRVRGGAIRLAPVATEIVLAEGMEDALTVQQETGLAAWASAGAGMMPSLVLPPCVQSVVIAADADERGEQQARAAAETFAQAGRRARIIRPMPPHKDFNAEHTAKMMEADNGR